MQSQWSHLKVQALQMRSNGTSITTVEKELNIPRSTLSGWFKNISLTKEQKSILQKNRNNALVFAREKAVVWHKKQKTNRLKKAEEEARVTLSKLNPKDKNLLEITLAMLYLGEGFKNNRTGLGNSDPIVLKFFIMAIKKLYSFDSSNIKCELHLRANQDPLEMKKHWPSELNIPLSNFTSISIDKRTIGMITYPEYKGVCSVNCGNIALQRKLVYLSQRFCEQIITSMGG